MSVEGYTGLWGSGKTLMLAVEGRRAMAAGRRVGATFRLDGAEYINPRDGLGALFEFRPDHGTRDVRQSVLLLIDEIGIQFPSRLWAKAPGDMLYYWSQAGKMGVEVRWSAQAERRVDTVVREVTHYVHRCHCISIGGRPRWVRTKTYYPGESEGTSEKARAEKRIRSRFVRIRPDVLASYNTLEAVEVAAHLDDKRSGSGGGVGSRETLPTTRRQLSVVGPRGGASSPP